MRMRVLHSIPVYIHTPQLAAAACKDIDTSDNRTDCTLKFQRHICMLVTALIKMAEK